MAHSRVTGRAYSMLPAGNRRSATGGGRWKVSSVTAAGVLQQYLEGQHLGPDKRGCQLKSLFDSSVVVLASVAAS